LGATPIQPGKVGVAVFFLISGFVIPFSFQSYRPFGFLVGRLLRIYPVYIVGFALTLASLTIGRWYFGAEPAPYSLGHIAAHFIPGARDTMNYKSIDGIVWTLEVEVRFYLVCAAAYALISKWSKAVFLIPVAFAVICHAIGRDIPGYIAYQQFYYTIAMNVKALLMYLNFLFIGVAFSYHYKGKLSVVALGLISLAVLANFIVTQAYGPQSAYWKSTAISYSAALVVFAVCYRYREGWRQTDVARFFARISYSLYVCHAMVGYAIMRILLDAGFTSPMLLSSIAMVATIGIATLLNCYIEKPSHALGAKLSRRLSAYHPDQETLVAAPTRA